MLPYEDMGCIAHRIRQSASKNIILEKAVEDDTKDKAGRLRQRWISRILIKPMPHTISVVLHIQPSWWMSRMGRIWPTHIIHMNTTKYWRPGIISMKHHTNCPLGGTMAMTMRQHAPAYGFRQLLWPGCWYVLFYLLHLLSRCCNVLLKYICIFLVEWCCICVIITILFSAYN